MADGILTIDIPKKTEEEKAAFVAKVKEVIYNTLNKNKIEIPFPQQDVYVRHIELPSGRQKKGDNTPVETVEAVLIEEEPNDTFIRDDNNLIYNLLLDFPTAALGGDVEIPTLEGTRLKVKMEPGTQPGKTLRLRGKGLPAVQGYGSNRGDLVVNVSVYVPKTLDRNEKEAIEQFRNSDNFKGDAETKRSIFQKFKNYFS